jgi:hypothetical protein
MKPECNAEETSLTVAAKSHARVLDITQNLERTHSYGEQEFSYC